VSSSLPVVELTPGEEKETELSLQAPSPPGIDTGGHPLTIRATSQKYSDQSAEVKVTLTLTAEVVAARLGIAMESQQLMAAPGSSTTFTLTLSNNSLFADSVRITVDGISTSWISTPSPITQLDPGEEKEISLTISPPRDHQSRAGRHPFTIRAVSQDVPDQMAEIACTLSIGAFMQFKSALQPEALEAGQNAQIQVKNEGNVSETFQIIWQSQEDVLAFELWQRQGEEDVFVEAKEKALRLEPGQQGTVHFRAGLRKRPFMGGGNTYPFQVLVRSSEGETLTQSGEVKDRALIPIWVLPVLVVLCLSVICIAVLFAKERGGQGADATATAEAATEVAVMVTQTIEAQETLSAQLTAGAPTNTPEPTPTEIPTKVPTDTLEPTDTEIPTEVPTNTPEGTEIPTEEPTEEPPPETEVPPPQLRGEILFVTNRSGVSEIQRLHAGNFAVEPIPGTANGDQPSWSPDGSRMAFTQNVDGNNEIVTMNQDGTDKVNLTNNPADDRDPAWSPDGNWIVFTSNRDGNLEIYVLPAGGGEAINLTVF
jgi:hypothetical protein